MAPPTILAHKSTFLTAQALHLSQNLAPSHGWRASNERAHSDRDHELTQKAVDDALYRLNHSLQQHAKRVYAPQASRHVAEQIEGLFLEAGERAVRGEEEDDDEDIDEEEEGQGGADDADGRNHNAKKVRGKLRIGADFATDEAISTLPPTWDVHKPAEAEAAPPEARRYAELAAELTSLSARRRDVRERLERLRRMDAVLAPLKDREAVQQNLVTRNGEVETELERMRVLLVRVAGRVAGLPDSGREEEGDGTGVDADAMDIDSAEREKVERLLDGF